MTVSYNIDRVKRDWEKSMKIHAVAREMRKLKFLANCLLRKGKKYQSPQEYSKTKKHAEFIIQGANYSLVDAKRMHYIEATPELIRRLDECIAVAEKERREVEVFLQSLKRGA